MQINHFKAKKNHFPKFSAGLEDPIMLNPFMTEAVTIQKKLI